MAPPILQLLLLPLLCTRWRVKNRYKGLFLLLAFFLLQSKKKGKLLISLLLNIYLRALVRVHFALYAILALLPLLCYSSGSDSRDARNRVVMRPIRVVLSIAESVEKVQFKARYVDRFRSHGNELPFDRVCKLASAHGGGGGDGNNNFGFI